MTGKKANIQTLLRILEQGHLRARHASFYQSPGDALFQAIAVVCGWVNEQTHALSADDHPPLLFESWILDQQGQRRSAWRLPSIMQIALGTESASCPSPASKGLSMGSGKFRLFYRVQTGLPKRHPDHSVCQQLVQAIETTWLKLFREKGIEACISCNTEYSPVALSDTTLQNTTRWRVTVLQRLREGLQRLVEELPEDYRRNHEKKAESGKIHPHFIWRCNLNQPDRLSPTPILPIQRLRIMPDRPDAVTAYETQQPRETDDKPLVSCLDSGSPVFSDRPVCHEPSADSDTHSGADDSLHYLYWPVSLLGHPVVCIQLALDTSNDRFPTDLVLGLMQLQEASWNIFFDVYHDILIEMLGDCYLAMNLTERGQGKETRQLREMTLRLQQASAYLSRVLGIPALQWSFCDDSQPPPFSVSLRQLQLEASRGEPRETIETLPLDDEARLQVLAREQHRLERIYIHPVGIDHDAPSERLTMFRHLSWRLGYYTHYQLPEVLMTLEHHYRHRIEREHASLRHELGGLINQAKRLLMRLPSAPGMEMKDLKLLMRLMHGTVQSIGHAGRIQNAPPGRVADVSAFFSGIERLFPSLFQLRGENGLKGTCRIIDLLDTPVMLPISEEQLLTLWRNLWDNGRKILDDHSRNDPGDQRLEIRQAILDRHGPYHERHGTNAPPLPVLLTVISILQHAETRHLRVDVLDNAPALANSPLDYPTTTLPGHHGLRLVRETCDHLTRRGVTSYFDSVRALSADDIQRLEPHRSRIEAFGQPLEVGHWSIVGFTIDLQESTP